MRTEGVGIRWIWTPLLAYCVLAFVAGVFPYLTLRATVQPIQVAQIVADAVAIWGLTGFVFRRSLRSPAVGWFFRLVAIVFVVRAIVVASLAIPSLRAWQPTSEQVVAALLLATIPLALLIAVALWRHAGSLDPASGNG